MNNQDIIDKYLNGSSISKLLIEYPELNRRKINKILLNNNITIRGGRKKKTFSEEQIEQIKTMINNGAFLNELADYFQVTPETMKLRLSDLDLKIKNTNRVNKQIKSNYFSVIDSPIKAYWLGFLFTDGSVDHYKATGRVRLQLQEQDLEVLEKFKEDLGLDCKIIHDKRINSTCCSVEFTDEQIFNDLAKYNIIPNKTYKINHIPYEKIPKEYLSAYALGLFDGDGGLTYSRDTFSDVTLGFTSYCEEEVLDFQNIIYQLNPTVNKNKTFFTSAWHCQWRGRLQVLSILDCLYKNCPRYLERKYYKYQQIKNNLN